MADRLGALGLSVDLEASVGPSPARPSAGATWPTGSSRTGQVAGPREAFARYLADGGPADVPKPRLDWTEAVALTAGRGASPRLAHPPYNLREATLKPWPTAASAPIEVAGPGINPNLGRRWRGWADALDLVPVAGSDFHAPDRPGRRVGAVVTPDADLERLRTASVAGLTPFRCPPLKRHRRPESAGRVGGSTRTNA